MKWAHYLLFLFLFSPSLWGQDTCWETKKCMELLGKYGGELGDSWKGILGTLVKDLGELNGKQKKLVVDAADILDPGQLGNLRYYETELEGMKDEYDRLLKMCQKGMDELVQKNTEVKKMVEGKKIQSEADKEKAKKILAQGMVEKKIWVKTGFFRRGYWKVENEPIEREPTDISTITPSELDFIFNYLAGKEYIPFDFPDDGCFARADEMIEIVEDEMNLNFGKVFIRANNDDRLMVVTKNHPSGCVRWGYHVAPYVKVKYNDKTVEMVLDPSIFKKPVTVDEWSRIQTSELKEKETLVLTHSKTYFSGDQNKKMNTLINREEGHDLITKFRLLLNQYLLEERKKTGS